MPSLKVQRERVAQDMCTWQHGPGPCTNCQDHAAAILDMQWAAVSAWHDETHGREMYTFERAAADALLDEKGADDAGQE